MSSVLEESVDVLGPLFAHARDAVIVGDLDANRILHWNPAAEALFGYSAHEAAARHLDSLIPPAVVRLQQVALDLHRRGSQHATGVPIETPVTHRSGASLHVECSFVPLDGARVMVMVRPTSARQQAQDKARCEAALHLAEARLDHQSAIIDRGLDDLSHPIARLRRATSRLQRALASGRLEHVEALASAIERRAERIQRLTQTLADQADIATGQLALQPRRVNLVPLLAAIVATARSKSKHHKINLAMPQGLTAMVDPRRIEQVIDTLLDHAMQRTPHGAWIDVDLRRPLVGVAHLEIHDYGRPSEHHEVDSVCRWIVEQHGGTLAVQYPTEGGERWRVTLPTRCARAGQ
jgi:PAS domain S-box-containing protein